MTNYAKHLSPLQTPQSQPLPGEPMIKNAAGGYVFELDDWQRLRRFIILGTSEGSYYASERQLTIEFVGMDASLPQAINAFVG